MKKKITVYTLLIALVVVMVVANVFAINYFVADNWLKNPENKADISSLYKVGATGPDKSSHISSWVRLPGNEKYYSALYGLIDVGNVATFNADVDGKQIFIEVYEVWANRYDGGEGGRSEEISDSKVFNYMDSEKVYGDVTVVTDRDGTAHDRFMVIHSVDEKEVDAVIYDLLASYYAERYGA